MYQSKVPSSQINLIKFSNSLECFTGLKQCFGNTEVLFKNVLTTSYFTVFYGKPLKAGTQRNSTGRDQSYIMLP